jgi:hypothetical protein
MAVIFLPSCNTRIEGCLDANADNFNLNAELPCDGCCTYPSLELVLSQKWGEENFANTDTLFDRTGQPYQIQDLRYFLTTWSWTDAQGQVYTVDSLDADCDGSTLRYTPDNAIIDTRKFVYTLGTTRINPVTTSVSYSLGLTRDFSCLDPEDPEVPADLTDRSPLWNPETSKLETLRLIIKRDLNSEIQDTLYMDLDDSQTLDYALTFNKGFDNQFALTVDYSLWFADVDIDSLGTFETSINSHFLESMFPTP